MYMCVITIYNVHLSLGTSFMEPWSFGLGVHPALGVAPARWCHWTFLGCAGTKVPCDQSTVCSHTAEIRKHRFCCLICSKGIIPEQLNPHAFRFWWGRLRPVDAGDQVQLWENDLPKVLRTLACSRCAAQLSLGWVWSRWFLVCWCLLYWWSSRVSCKTGI